MRIFKIVLSVALLCAVCRTEEEPAKLPEGVDALPSELRVKLKDLLKNAEKYRGLNCLHGVPSGSLKEDMLRTKMRLAFEEELPPAKMRPYEAALKAFDFIPQEMQLGKYLPELLTSQVGGYYDPRRNYFVIVQREGGLLGKEMKEKLGESLAARMEETVMVHELTHALQDQHFDLKKFMIPDPLSDAGTARTALVEGDATLTMYNFFGQMKMEELPGAEEIVTQMLKDPKQLMAMTPDMPGAKEMENAPEYFRDTLLFSYMQGFVFSMHVKKTGGQALLDYAFTTDPPKSSEQIIHPEKWMGQRDDPVEIAMPDWAASAPGWNKITEGTLGELGVRILLNRALHDPDASAKAAEGWGGDRFAVLEKNNERVLCWVTDWDTESDAKKFKAAAAKLGESWQAVSPNAKRVTLTRVPENRGGGLAIVMSVMGAMADAKASIPENKRIDMTAFGKKNDAAGALEELANGLNKNGKLDVDKLLNDPNFDKALDSIGGKNGGDGPDLSGLMKSPMVKGLLKNMLSQKAPEGKLSEDGREYNNETLGIGIKLPDAAKEWKLDTNAPIPMTALAITSPDSAVQIQVATQPMPMEIPIEQMGPMLEMGIKMMIKNFTKHKAGTVGEGVAKGFEIQYSGAQMGMTIRATQRVYMRGGKMLVISAIAPPEKWGKNEAAINAVLDAFKLTAPKAQPAEAGGNGEKKEQINDLLKQFQEQPAKKEDAK